MKRSWISNPLIKWIVLFSALSFGLALLIYALTGFQARYWADDYCYNTILQADGFWKAQFSFYRHTSDRFSVIPLVGVSEIFGSQAIRFWPVVSILLALTGITWVVQQAAFSGGWKISTAWRLLAAEIILFFTFLQAPNLFQVLYWRTGMLTYFMPLVFNIFLTGWILKFARQRGALPGGQTSKSATWTLAITFLLAFFGAGFSETNAALQAGILGLALAYALFRLWRQGKNLRTQAAAHLPFLITALIATALSMIILVISPSNQLRLMHMPKPAGLGALLVYSFRFGWDFIQDTFATQWLPTLLSIITAFALGISWQIQTGQAADPRRTAARLSGSLFAMYVGIVCVCAPSVYVEVAYPEARALIGARFMMVLGLSLAGWFAGQLASTLATRLRISPALVLAGGMLALGLASLYPIHAVRSVLVGEYRYFQERAAQWDARDQEIRRLAQQGQTQIEVAALDSIRGLMELQSEPGQFPNGCIAGTYGIKNIKGIIK